jgi:hypothetical protein
MSEQNGNGSGEFSIIAQLLPGAAADADSKEEIVPLLGPDKERPKRPDGSEVKVDVVFGFLDGQTQRMYHRIAEQNGKRGKPNYDAAVIWLFKKKCKRIEGLDGDPLLGGRTAIEYFVQDKNGITLLNMATIEYMQRQLGSADESYKSR